MSGAGFRRRLGTVTVTLTAAVLTAAGTLTPALAATGPSITVNDGSVNIAVQGADDSLLVDSAVIGTGTWSGETVAGEDTTFSAPSIATDGNGVNIAAEGPVTRWCSTGAPTARPPGTP
jgi:hypothetical protein